VQNQRLPSAWVKNIPEDSDLRAYVVFLYGQAYQNGLITLKMEATCSSDTSSALLTRTTRHHIPEDNILLYELFSSFLSRRTAMATPRCNSAVSCSLLAYAKRSNRHSCQCVIPVHGIFIHPYSTTRVGNIFNEHQNKKTQEDHRVYRKSFGRTGSRHTSSVGN
jgi:hypothetical protein